MAATPRVTTREQQLERTAAAGAAAFAACFAAGTVLLRPYAVDISAAYSGVDAGRFRVTAGGAREQRCARRVGRRMRMREK
jgi:hypothetical protein